MRRLGKSYAHPLIVLIVLPNGQDASRFGISAGRSVGKAVQRNRARRLIREALRPLLPDIQPGWDVVVLARAPILEAPLPRLSDAISALLRKASLIRESHE